MHNNLCARQQGTRKTGDWGPCQCCNEGGNEAACNALYNGQYIYRDRIKYRSVRCEGGNCDPNTKPATTAKCTRANTTECQSDADDTDLILSAWMCKGGGQWEETDLCNCGSEPTEGSSFNVGEVICSALRPTKSCRGTYGSSSSAICL